MFLDSVRFVNLDVRERERERERGSSRKQYQNNDLLPSYQERNLQSRLHRSGTGEEQTGDEPF